MFCPPICVADCGAPQVWKRRRRQTTFMQHPKANFLYSLLPPLHHYSCTAFTIQFRRGGDKEEEWSKKEDGVRGESESWVVYLLFHHLKIPSRHYSAWNNNYVYDIVFPQIKVLKLLLLILPHWKIQIIWICKNIVNWKSLIAGHKMSLLQVEVHSQCMRTEGFKLHMGHDWFPNLL